MELKKVNYISDEELTSYKKELFNSIINDSSFYKEVLLSSFTNEDIMSNLSLFDEWRTNFNIVNNLLKNYVEGDLGFEFYPQNTPAQSLPAPKSKLVNLLQSLNIELIFVTFEVSNLLTSKLVKPLQ